LFSEGVRAEQKQRAEAARPIRNAERKALDTLGLDAGVTPQQVKAKFKELVKRHHPDANGGDRSTEDRLVEIIQAYNYLKSVGLG
jgi:DnaJ-class molecular chaperone